MAGVRRRFWSAGVAALISAALPAAAQAPADPLEAKVAGIRDRFVAAVRSCGVEPRFTPAVQILSQPAVIAYIGSKRTLVIGRWETLPPPIQDFLGRWAAHDMPGEGPQALFDQLFNGFLVGHELGHWVEDQSGRLDAIDPYDGELEANRIAIAFAALTPTPPVEQTVGRFSYLSTLPNPVPAGQDARAYFNANYWDLSTKDPLAYNWYQGVFMREAWRRRDEADFCALIKLPSVKTS